MARARRTLVALAAVALVAVAAIAIVVVPAEIVYSARNGHLYHREEPAADRTGAGGDYRLYRAPFAIAKAPGKTRVLAIGGSTTYGFGLAAAQAWPAQLQQLLDEQRPGTFEVVNLGYLGGHLEAFIADFAHASRRYVTREAWLEGERPSGDDVAAWGWRDLGADIVVVAPVVNDTAPDFAALRNPGAEWRRRLARRIERAPLLSRLAIAHYASVFLRSPPGRPPPFDAAAARETVRARYGQHLREFIALWSPGQRIVLVGLPWLFNADDPPASAALAASYWGVQDVRELEDERTTFPALEGIEVETRKAMRDGAARRLEGGEVARELKASPFRQRLRNYLDAVHGTAEAQALYARDVRDMILRATR
jgi:hypothetical protein